MIQLILSGALLSNRLLKRHCLSDPETLLELGQQASRPGVDPDDLAGQFSLVLHDVRVGGTWKRTNRGRLTQTEMVLRAHISPEFGEDLVFLDVGASDGVTTVEAVRALRQAFGDHVKGYAADLNLWLLRYRWGPVVEYRARDGEPIMVRVGLLGLRLAKQRHGLAQHNGDLLRERYLRWQRLRSAMRMDARISLVNPLARREPGVAVIELDCLHREARLQDRISAIRASNVLNLGYFVPAQISEAVGNFHSYLRRGGCLVISQNGDGATGESENGSAWIKEADGFRRVDDFGCGSEVGSLVDAWRLADAGEVPTVSAKCD